MTQRPKIETNRLLLARPSNDHIDQYFHDIVGTDIFDTLLWEGPSNVKEMHDYWEACDLLDPTDFTLPINFAIIEKQTNTCIGGCDLRPINKNPAIIGIGFALAPKYHGRGFATEAIKAMVHEAFESRGAMRVFGNAFVGNEKSKNVFEKLGFTLEGTLRCVVQKRGKWLDEWSLAIIRDDWEKSEIFNKDN